MLELPLAAEEPVRWCRQPDRRHFCFQHREQLGIVLENAPLQLAQLNPGLQSELVAQVVAGRGVELERFRLAPAAVEGEHRLRLHTLARAVLGCEACQLRQELRVAAKRQLGLDPLLERDQAKLLEPLCLRTGKLLVRDLGVRPSAP